MVNMVLGFSERGNLCDIVDFRMGKNSASNYQVIDLSKLYAPTLALRSPMKIFRSLFGVHDCLYLLIKLFFVSDICCVCGSVTL